jgi:hypothetical protein
LIVGFVSYLVAAIGVFQLVGQRTTLLQVFLAGSMLFGIILLNAFRDINNSNEEKES